MSDALLASFLHLHRVMRKHEAQRYGDCEVCNGDGEHSEPRPFHDDPYYEHVTACPNCKGSGIVEIEDRAPPYPPVCRSCGKSFRDGDTCPRGGCPMGGDF